MEMRQFFSSCTIFSIIITVSFVTTTTSQSLSTNKEFKKLCIIIALPGSQHGLDLKRFKTFFDQQLNTIGVSVFGNIPHAERMKLSEKCTPLDISDLKCAYHRISDIYEYLLGDLTTLRNQLGRGNQDASYMYTALLSTWYLDRVFLAIDCGTVDVKTHIPASQLNYIAIWSHQLDNRNRFCTLSKALGKSTARNLRRDVNHLCYLREEPICQLRPIFDMVDTMENLCDLVPLNAWNTASGDFEYLKNAAYVSFYSMRPKTPSHNGSSFHKNTQESAVREAILDIFFKVYEDFRKSNLTLVVKLLKVLPKSMYLPCDFTSQFPSFKWLICATSKSFNELQAYIKTYGTETSSVVRYRKYLESNIDYREYIKNLKETQIKELTEKNAINLQGAAVAIKNNIQERFQQLGTYFSKVAEYEKAKLNADVDYIKGRIATYKRRFNKYSEEIAAKMKTLFAVFIGTAYADVRLAQVKMAIKIAKAGNPLKWLFDSGNADEILESATEIAKAGALLIKSIKSAVNFNKLVNYSKELAQKMLTNKNAIINVGNIMNNVQDAVESSSDQFEKYQTDFLQSYRDYDPKVTKDDLAKLDSYWDLFIDEVCDGIDSTGSIPSTVIKGLSGSGGHCMDAKKQAAQLVACQEEIYDLQFELMETMASVVRSLTQIESSKILGSGPKAQHQSGLDIKTIQTLVAVSSMSYTIMQMRNVQMLCDIIEYEQGRKSNLCTGLSTDIDKLISLRNPICNSQLQYISVPSKPPSNNANDRSWLDLTKLYKGEEIQFQIPNSSWVIEHLKLPASQKMNSFYVTGFEVYVPVVSKQQRTIVVSASPTNINNKLFDHSVTNYIITPAESMRIKYAEGYGISCRLRTISNPYYKCGGKERDWMPMICPISLDTETSQGQGRLFPSIYSQLNIRLDGYQDIKLDEPVTDVPVKIGLRYCSVDQFFTQKRSIIRSKSQTDANHCCPKQHYYNERSNRCDTCPPGSRSFYNGLFCGEVIKLLVSPDFDGNSQFTYSKAEELCRNNGAKIASLLVLAEARNLNSESCDCGWFEGSTIDSISTRAECNNKACPAAVDVKYVYCTTVFVGESVTSAMGAASLPRHIHSLIFLCIWVLFLTRE